MNTRAINAADAVVRRYNSRNPEEIISRRAIKVKDIRYCRDLLGYYSVMLMGVPIYSGISSTQTVNMIPLPESVDFNKYPGGNYIITESEVPKL